MGQSREAHRSARPLHSPRGASRPHNPQPTGPTRGTTSGNTPSRLRGGTPLVRVETSVDPNRPDHRSLVGQGHYNVRAIDPRVGHGSRFSIRRGSGTEACTRCTTRLYSAPALPPRTSRRGMLPKTADHPRQRVHRDRPPRKVVARSQRLVCSGSRALVMPVRSRRRRDANGGCRVPPRRCKTACCDSALLCERLR
jgi:hypothetical protein